MIYHRLSGPKKHSFVSSSKLLKLQVVSALQTVIL